MDNSLHKWSLFQLVIEDAEYAGSIDASLPLWIPLHEKVLADESMSANDILCISARREDSDRLMPFLWRDRTSGRWGGKLRFDEWFHALREEQYRSAHLPAIMAKLPFNYHLLPEFFRDSVAKILLKFMQKKDDAKLFPVSCLNVGPAVCAHLLRPSQQQPVVALTHDVETGHDAGTIEKLADLEERLGFRSCWNIIPLRHTLDLPFWDSLVERGHEVGLHGFWHTTAESFLNRNKFGRIMGKLEPLRQRLNIQGYRAPAWVRTQQLYRNLADYFLYDSSCPDADALCFSGHGGVGSIWPYRLDAGLLELPCTVPFEAPLYQSSISPGDLPDFWEAKIDFIVQSNGVVLVLTHTSGAFCGNPAIFSAYRRLLEKLRSLPVKFSLPRELAKQHTDEMRLRG